MCGHCGNVYQDMYTLAHHLNVRKMHMELSKIEGYDMRTFPQSVFLATLYRQRTTMSLDFAT